MGNLVLDASAVVRIIEGSEQSASFQEAVLNADLVLAPELMLTEVANALWRLQRSGQLPAEGLQRRLSRAAELVDVIEPDRHLQVEALALACHLDHPVYDCLYLALARREAAVLLTADQRLQQLAARVLPCTFFHDPPPPCMSESDVVIRVEGLGKKYSLHHEQSERYTALRDVVARQAKAAGRLLNPFTLAGQLRKAKREAALEHAASEEEFWALKDVSFEIRRGERVGIIGRNGAGKSTLLKILSRITEPTTGRVEIRGRVASLLEVGTGFHPELTGRENIYLNGAILGMTRREIRSKFDEIVDFAEVEKFLDTPVKRYSSGMYVRLAFAVAAHLEPEILVVDEVLAVGDASFQKKCLGKMQTVSKQGRTVIFVSHQLDAINRLCERCAVLERGLMHGPTNVSEGLQRYLDNSPNEFRSELQAIRNQSDFHISNVQLRNHANNKVSAVMSGENVSILISYSTGDTKLPLQAAVCSIQIKNELEVPIFHIHNQLTGHVLHLGSASGSIKLLIPNLPLPAGRYTVSAWIYDNQKNSLDSLENCISFAVEYGDFYGTGFQSLSSHGLVYIQGVFSHLPRHHDSE